MELIWDHEFFLFVYNWFNLSQNFFIEVIINLIFTMMVTMSVNKEMPHTLAILLNYKYQKLKASKSE